MTSYRFRPGDIVVCVEDAPPFAGAPMGGLREGHVYLVAYVDDDLLRGAFLGLEGVGPAKGYHGYLARRFRPADPRRIDVFRSILRQAPVHMAPVEDRR